jgi:hypothetical protein
MKRYQLSAQDPIQSQRYLMAFISLMGLMEMTLPSRAIAEDSCAKNPQRIEAVVQMTASGQRKVAQLAYEFTRRSTDEYLKLIKQNPPPFGANRELCNKNVIDKQSPETIKQKCFGLLPGFLWNGNASNVSLDGRLEPVEMTMTDLQIKTLELDKKPKITCKNNSCEVLADVHQLDLGFNIKARSINETCDQFGLKDVKFNLKPYERQKKHPQIRLKFRYTGNLKEPIQVDWNDSKFTVSVDEIEANATSVIDGEGMCKTHPKLKKIAADLAQDMVAENQFVMDMILDKVKTLPIQNFVTEQMAQIAKLNGIGSDLAVNAPIPTARDLMDRKAMVTATKIQEAKANEYLGNVMNSHSTDALATYLAKTDPRPGLRELINNFKSSKTQSTLDQTEYLANVWSANSKRLTELAAITSDPRLKDLLKNEIPKLDATVSLLDQFAQQLRSGIPATKDDLTPILLSLTALQANDLQSEIEAKVSACYRCSHSTISGTGGTSWGFDRGDHDFAFKTGYGSINRILAEMAAESKLDTCVVIDSQKDCKDVTKDDIKIDVHFPNAPEIVWDESSGTFAIRVKQIQLDNQKGILGFLGRKMEADVTLPGRLTLSEDGQTIRFQPIADKIKISNPDVSHARWEPTRLLTKLVAWATEKMADTAFSHRQIAKRLTTEMGIPYFTTLTQIKATPEGFGVYVKLPEDPTFLLPRDGNSGRALATTRK